MTLIPINPRDLSLLSIVALFFSFVLFSPFCALVLTILSNFLELLRLRHIPKPARNALSLITTVFRASPDKTAIWFNSLALRTPVMRLSGFLLTTNVISLSPEGVRVISSMPTSFPKPSILIKILNSFTGNASIFGATGAEHRRLRAVIAPPLRHSYIVQHLQKMFFREARAIATDLVHADDLMSGVRVGTFRVVMHAYFGIDFIDREEIDRLGRLYDVALQTPVHIIILRRFVHPDSFPTAWISVAERAREEVLTVVRGLCERVVPPG